MANRRKPDTSKRRPGKGKFVIVLPNGSEDACFKDLLDAKDYLDSDKLPRGSEVVRRRDGKTMAFLAKVPNWGLG